MPEGARKPSKFEKQSERILDLFYAHAFLWCGGAAVIAAVVVWLSQVLAWLEHGWMPAYPIADLWFAVFGDFPVISWKGVEKIVYWVLDQNAGLAAFLLGVILLLSGSGLLTEVNEVRRKEEAKKERQQRPQQAPDWDDDAY